MNTRNPQNQEPIAKTKFLSKKPSLQNPLEYIEKNQLNKSKAKMQFSFPKSERFSHSLESGSADKYYDLPPVLKTQRSSSFGYGTKTDFSKLSPSTPSPGNYQILRDFEGNSKQGSWMGLSRQLIKFNDLFKTQTNTSFPQPASYNITSRIGGQRLSIGQRFTQKKKWIDFVPGPGNYNHQQPTGNLKSTISNFRTSPGTKFPKTQRLKQLTSTDKLTPGPGNYKQLSSIKKDGTTFGKASRDQKISHSKVFGPGPGAYQLFSEFLH